MWCFLNGMVWQVRQLAEAPWGGSTDFRRALNMVLQETAPRSEAPNLLVVSDMNFNEACIDAEEWALMHAEIVAAYDAKGCRTPTIFYWNVNADDQGVQETVHVPGVVMMNGFSPSMIGYVFTRQYAPAASGHGSRAPKREMRPTTISLVRKILADADMARVRDAVSLSLRETVDAGACLGCGV
tara:strand:+ start:1625 stop:2176 length:552 start_codon:yes stop_codon:yes gene_type:complete